MHSMQTEGTLQKASTKEYRAVADPTATDLEQAGYRILTTWGWRHDPSLTLLWHPEHNHFAIVSTVSSPTVTYCDSDVAASHILAGLVPLAQARMLADVRVIRKAGPCNT